MPPQLILSSDHRVALDYGQFYLESDLEDHGDLATELLEQALTDGIGQGDGIVVLTSPHQNNFDMALRVEIWSAEPTSDLDEWQEAFELHLDVSDCGLHYYSPTLDSVDLEVPPGSYHALVTGRGFVARGWPGSTTPGDTWRIQLFPSENPLPARRLRSYVQPRFVVPPPVFRDAGIAATRRLRLALDDRMPLSGKRATATTERTIPGTRRSLYKYFEAPSGWLTQGGSRDESGNFYLTGGYLDDSPFADVNRIVPTNGVVRCRRIQATSPVFSEVTWTWEGRDDDGVAKAIVPSTPQMTLRFDLLDGPAEPDWPTVVVRVVHAEVPEEFIDDLTAYWSWMLERADYNFDLSGRRMKQARELINRRAAVP